MTEEYVPDAGERVLCYRRLSESLKPVEVNAIEEEMIDRFGRPTGPAANLFDSIYIRHYASRVGISDVSVMEGAATLVIPEAVEVTRAVVEQMVRKSPVKLNFSFRNGMQISFTNTEERLRPLEGVKKVLQALVA